MTVGYSGTPLAKKLGIKEGFSIYTVGAPDDLEALLEPLPDDVYVGPLVSGKADIIHIFTNCRDELFRELARCSTLIKQNCRPRSSKTRSARPLCRSGSSTSKCAPSTKNGPL